MLILKRPFLFILLMVIIPITLLSQEEIEMNLVDQFHFEYSSVIIGLTYDGEYLWMSDIIADSLIAIDTETGNKVYGFPFPMESDIYGLTFDGENFWASASRFYLYKISHEDGSIITSFHIPYPMASNGRITGLTWHNDILYCMNTSGLGSRIIGVDVATISCVDTLGTAECSSPTGLTYMNDYFWFNDYIDIKIRKANPEYGQYEGWIPHYYLCYKYIGMTNDGEYMYCSDNYRNIYKYEIIENSDIVEDNVNQPDNPIQISTFPNPFNPEVVIKFSLPKNSKINLDIYNIKGQKVKSIENSKHLREGEHSYIWEAENSATGIYFIKLSTNFGDFNHKLTLIK